MSLTGCSVSASRHSPIGRPWRCRIGHISTSPIDYQDIYYYSAPKPKSAQKDANGVDPELNKTFDKLGIPLQERAQLSGMAVDAVMDSVSVKTTFKESLAELGIIFCSISSAVRDYPDLVHKYLGSVVPYTDNFLQPSTPPYSATAHSCIYPKGCAALWNFLPISASMRPRLASLSAL